MSDKESLLNKKVSIKHIGAVIGGALLTAAATGLFWHRRAIKRLIELRQM